MSEECGSVVPKHGRAISALVDELSLRADQLATEIAAQIRVEVPGYERVPVSEHILDVRAQIRTILTGLRTGRLPPPAAFQQARDVGRRRAAGRLALPDLVEAYHIAYRDIWNELLTRAAPHPGLTAILAGEVALLWSLFHRLAGAATDAHATETRMLAAARVTVRGRFVEMLTNADADAEALATVLGFAPDAEFFAACTGPLDEQTVDQIDAEFVSAGIPALAVGRSGRGLIIGQEPADLVSAVRSQDAGTRIGLGLKRRGIAGAAMSVRDATETADFAIATGRDAKFSDDWHAVVMHAAKGRLTALLDRGSLAATKHPVLADTVRAYAHSGFSVAETARVLRLHPSTAKYRLRRWHALTGWDVHRLEDLTASMVCLSTIAGCQHVPAS